MQNSPLLGFVVAFLVAGSIVPLHAIAQDGKGAGPEPGLKKGSSEPKSSNPAGEFKPLTAWRGYVTHNTMPDGWTNEDGVISLAKGGKGRFLVTSDEFANFDLKFEWKVSPGGNSGVFYRTDEKHPSPPHTGPEYQIVDNVGNKLGRDPLRSAGSCLSVYGVAKDFAKPVGEWNTGRILCQGNRVEHWLNDEKVVAYELGSDDWKTHVSKSDFSTARDFGRLVKGRIALQGKGDAVWFRKFMIRTLPDQPMAGWADKILILGNSITVHGPLQNIEWTHNHGMAASAPEKDFAHLLLKRFAQDNGGREPVAIVENIADFERNFATIDVRSRFKKHAEFQADVVILAIAENVPGLPTAEDKKQFKTAVAELLGLLKRGGTQRIIVRGSYMGNAQQNEILRDVCREVGGVYVDLTDIAKDPTTRADVEYAGRKLAYMKYPGVGGHPGDKGMALIADAIWRATKPVRDSDVPSVVAPGAKLDKVAENVDTPEGPTVDAEGNVYFTNQQKNRILKWENGGKLSTFLEPAGGANGMYFDGKGRLVVCANEKHELWRLDVATKKYEVLAGEYDGKPFNSPNDVWVRPSGGHYITDPFYGAGKAPQGTEQVYFVAADGKTVKRVTTDLARPNGITGTPDGKHLFVGDMALGRTYRYTIREDGTLGDKAEHCPLGSDGMTIDTDGNLYLTGIGVTVFDKSGKKIERIEVPNSTTNVCFGGKDRQTLFITGSNVLYSIRTRTKGANPAK